MCLCFLFVVVNCRGVRFSESDVKDLLDTSEASLRQAAERLSMDYTLIRKEKAVGASINQSINQSGRDSESARGRGALILRFPLLNRVMVLALPKPWLFWLHCSCRNHQGLARSVQVRRSGGRGAQCARSPKAVRHSLLRLQWRQGCVCRRWQQGAGDSCAAGMTVARVCLCACQVASCTSRQLTDWL
jgi:hypothetical protein